MEKGLDLFFDMDKIREIFESLPPERIKELREMKWEGFNIMDNFYPVTDKDLEGLNNSYTYHPPKPDQIPRYELIRSSARDFAYILLTNCPPSRERSIALTQLELAVMAANKAIACNE